MEYSVTLDSKGSVILNRDLANHLRDRKITALIVSDQEDGTAILKPHELINSLNEIMDEHDETYRKLS